MANKIVNTKLYLGIDQGTSSTKAILCSISSSGKITVHWENAIPIRIRASSGGRVEQDPEELTNSILKSSAMALNYADQHSMSVVTCGLSLQRSGVLAWENKTLEILHPLISHRDSRFSAEIHSIYNNHDEITGKTGLPVLPNYAAPKISALQDKFHSPNSRVGTLDSYLFARFTRRDAFVSEHSLAARTMLYHLQKGDWHPGLCKIFNVDLARLPKIVPSLHKHGLLNGVPIMASLGDQQAALFAARSMGANVQLNLGTIASLMCIVKDSSPRLPGFTTSVALCSELKEREFMVESVLPDCATFIDYLAKMAGVEPGALDHLATDGSPSPLLYWKRNTRNFQPICEDSAEQNRISIPTLIRSGFEHLAARIGAKLFQMLEAGMVDQNRPLLVSGGVARSNMLLQNLANLTGLKIDRTALMNFSSLGAALAAARISPKTLSVPNVERHFLPDSSLKTTKRVKERFQRWQDLSDTI